jgi:hypothetical protein
MLMALPGTGGDNGLCLQQSLGCSKAFQNRRSGSANGGDPELLSLSSGRGW